MPAEPELPLRRHEGRAVSRESAALVLFSVALSAYVIGYPFTLAEYPPLTDLPFHAAQASIFRHYLDPAFHFREQFSLHPLEAPYVSMYALGAFLALFTSITTASKLMAMAMLALVPSGLAVLCHGMKKSPLWGLLGLSLTWCTTTQWGFFSYMGAIGLSAMSVGFALLVVDDPTRTRRIGLALSLVVLFFTHVYRFPFTLVAVLLAGAIVYPSTKRFSPLAVPLAPALVLFSIWLWIRPHEMSLGALGLRFHPERLHEIPKHLFGAYLPLEGARPTPEGIGERDIFKRMLGTGLFTLAASALLFFGEGRARRRNREAFSWGVGVGALPLILAAGSFVAYLTLPLDAGVWFYVYPREMIATAVMLMAAGADLPIGIMGRLAFCCLFAAASVPMTRFVAHRFREFDSSTADFRSVVQAMPQAPKLFYLIYYASDFAKRVSPFLHLPAWIQAEKGGALGFHFAQWGLYPIRYRIGSAKVPPELPHGFEWTPEYFDVQLHGTWFDTFLVRHTIDPHELFDADPSVRLVLHKGTWWMYRRSPP
jgi:hypothetical protein